MHNSTYNPTFTTTTHAIAQGWLSVLATLILALCTVIPTLSTHWVPRKRLQHVYVASLHDFSREAHQTVGVFDNSDAALDALQQAYYGRFGEMPGNVLPRNYLVIESDQKGRRILAPHDVLGGCVAIVERMSVRSSKF